MKIIKVEDRNRKLIEILLNIWEDSVRATHLFLASKDIDKIKEYVPQALENVEKLVVLENDASELVAFMGVQDKKIEMLFIKNSERGKGLGKQLIKYGIKKYGINEVAVNEQNPMAKGFYEHVGFRVYKRTELDEQGEPFPILYMKLEKENKY